MTFYKPLPGVVGDVIPYYYDGVFHIFYLRSYRDIDGYGPGGPWHHVSTTDFLTFTDHGEAIVKGAELEQDSGPATGSVFTDDDGLHHIFYTGINAHFRNDDQREQVILHATSPDLLTWTKDPDFANESDETRYERHDWRDPFVYRHPQTDKPMMLVAARTKAGDPSTRGCTAILEGNRDLTEWTDVGAYAPGRYHGHECPDLFQIGGWWYLVFSEYTTSTVTRYVMSRTPDGPWVAPPDNQFDNRAFYAAKSFADDLGRRYMLGWNPSKLHDVDEGEWQWGGCLTVHEVTQRTNGTLAVRLPRSIAHSFDTSGPVARTDLSAAWDTTDGKITVDATGHRRTTVIGPLPHTALLEGELTFSSHGGRAGVLLNVAENGDREAEGGYFLRFDADLQRVQFGKVGGYRPWFVDQMPELDRPLAIHQHEAIHYRIIVDGSAVVAYVNDDVALSARMYGRPRRNYGLFADEAAVRFDSLGIRTGGTHTIQT